MNPLHHPDHERCKKLTEIGFPFGDLHYFNDKIETTDWLHEWAENHLGVYDKSFRCPSVMEMLDELYGKEIKYKAKEKHDKDNWIRLRVHIEQADLWYVVMLRGRSKEFGKEMKFWKTHCGKWEGWLANAIADLIIWLVENNHLTLWKN